MIRELRLIDTEYEVRAADAEAPARVSGYGIVYDREVEIYPGYKEKIRSGAFSKSIKNATEIKSFINHDASMVLSTTRSNPALILIEDEKGVRFESPIPPTSYGNDLQINLERKNVRGASFSFTINDGGDIVIRDEQGVYHREITEGTVYEMGPVTNPAYPMAKVGLRSIENVVEDIKSRCSSNHINDDDDTHELLKDYLLTMKGV